MSRRNLNSRQPAKNIGAKAPTRKVTRADGVQVTEKVNPMRFKKKCVSPDGDVIELSLATGFTIVGFKGNDYGVQVWEEKQKAGFLPYDECPVATGRVPRGKEDPCLGSDGLPRKFSDEACCQHLAKVIEARRAEHRKTQLEYGKNFSTHQERMIQLLEAQTERMAKAEVQPSGKKGIAGG